MDDDNHDLLTQVTKQEIEKQHQLDKLTAALMIGHLLLENKYILNIPERRGITLEEDLQTIPNIRCPACTNPENIQVRICNFMRTRRIKYATKRRCISKQDFIEIYCYNTTNRHQAMFTDYITSIIGNCISNISIETHKRLTTVTIGDERPHHHPITCTPKEIAIITLKNPDITIIEQNYDTTPNKPYPLDHNKNYILLLQ